MTIFEKDDDVFDYWGRNDVYFVHCISADCAMGAGIAKQFVNKFKEVNRDLRKECKSQIDKWQWTCTITYPLYSIVTKDYYYEKPTYKSMRLALKELAKTYMTYYVANSLDGKEAPVKTLIMPRIGCGLDRLEWSKVKTLIEEVFKFLPVTIIVCNKRKERT